MCVLEDLLFFDFIPFCKPIDQSWWRDMCWLEYNMNKKSTIHKTIEKHLQLKYHLSIGLLRWDSVSETILNKWFNVTGEWERKKWFKIQIKTLDWVPKSWMNYWMVLKRAKA